jgi:diguanylate cyclase (GGDEF)-like protein
MAAGIVPIRDKPPISIRVRRANSWIYYCLVALALAGTYFLLPEAGTARVLRVVLYCVISSSAAVAIFVGVWLWRPQPRGPWLLLGLGQVIYAAADATFYTSHDLFGLTAFPAPSDALYLAHYPVMVLALIQLIRLRAPMRNLDGLLDAGTLGVAATLLWWLILIEPQVQADTTMLARIAAVGYPVMDLALLVVAIRLVLEQGRRPASFFLICGSLLLIMAADTIYVLQQLNGNYETGNVLDLLWLAGNIALGAAALHPTMAGLAESAPPTRQVPGLLRIATLTVAALVAPATLALENLRGYDRHELVIAGACALLFLLTILRMAGLISEQRRLATTDGLTGLASRRYLETRLATDVARARRSGGSVGLVLVDVDHFKQVNDRYGHPAGDRVLVEMAHRLREASMDGVLARFGGEEFALMVPNPGPQELAEVAERLRHQVAQSPMSVGSDVRTSVTVSVGAASFPEHASDLGDLVGVVDSALYAAKARGRDRVVVGKAPTATSGEADGASRMLEYLSFVAEDIDGRLSGHEHSGAVARWARVVARELGLDADTVLRAELAGRLHDVGKIVIPDAILTKATDLSDREWALMAQHSEYGYRMTFSVPGLAPVAEIIRQHHERFDGLGYPDRLSGESIRVEARVIAICDSWSAMRADRIYQPALSEERAREEMLHGCGTQFDPDLVEVFLDLRDRGLIGELRRLRPGPRMLPYASSASAFQNISS